MIVNNFSEFLNVSLLSSWKQSGKIMMVSVFVKKIVKFLIIGLCLHYSPYKNLKNPLAKWKFKPAITKSIIFPYFLILRRSLSLSTKKFLSCGFLELIPTFIKCSHKKFKRKFFTIRFPNIKKIFNIFLEFFISFFNSATQKMGKNMFDIYDNPTAK